jgi:hypothetical protein
MCLMVCFFLKKLFNSCYTKKSSDNMLIIGDRVVLPCLLFMFEEQVRLIHSVMMLLDQHNPNERLWICNTFFYCIVYDLSSLPIVSNIFPWPLIILHPFIVL